MAAKTPPTTNVPESSTTVQVSAIDSTMFMEGFKCGQLWEPAIKGFDRFKGGTWAFLIEHPSGRKLLYDLGLRKDFLNLPPALGMKQLLDSGVIAELRVEKNVADILTKGGLDLNDVEGIIWSHFHFDHTGDVSTFPKTTKLIVGPGTKSNFMPGYPTDPSAHTLDSDFEGRTVEEVDFSQDGMQLGRFQAVDWFGDGSFYLLDSPGHTIGHINALARTNASPSSSFIHMCGDAVHHAGEMRPTSFLPLPDSIEPSPVPHLHSEACPGHMFASVLRNGSRTDHILEAVDFTAGQNIERKYAGMYDNIALRDSVRKTEELDADADVFTVMAHDWTLKGVIPEWPESLNGWKERQWKQSTRWKFLADFQEACVS